jgi:hypothetical protein
MAPEPVDPISSIAESAAATHEMFISYVAAGFTEPQALYLIGQMLAAMTRPQQ